ncbi:MAG: histidinol dehydrogenase, partial [Arenimonas sp.]|nr:histidinol dehydrogenase [Arenimonas sp.]
MKRIVWSELDAAGRAECLARPGREGQAEIEAAVRRVFEQVRADGDSALRALTRRFDGVELDSLSVTATEWQAALAQVPQELTDALSQARGRLQAWHTAGMAGEFEIETAPGVRCGRLLRPIRRVGLYVPAGTAPLPSTALMLGVPAALAGCEEVVLCTPPRADGSADPAVLA